MEPRERSFHTSDVFIGWKTLNPNFGTLLLHAATNQLTFWKGQNLQRCQHSFIEVFQPSARDEPLRKAGEERWNVTSEVTPALPSLLPL